MKSLLFACAFFISLGSFAQKTVDNRDSAFAQMRRLFDNRSFVVAGAVYNFYDLSLKGCTFEYKIHFIDQDSNKKKISVHRAYVVNLKEIGPGYTKTLITRTSWLVLKARSGTAITENILPEPKKGMIAKPVITRTVSTAFIPIDFNDKKYENAFNKLLGYCR
jgi:hypothetical protein